MSDTQKAPLWKQLLGAITGAAVALVLYEAYVIVTPKLTALVTLPTSQAPSTFDDVGTIAGTRPLWPTGTLGSPAVAPSSSSSSSSAFAHSTQSSAKSSISSYQNIVVQQPATVSSSSSPSVINAYGRGMWPTTTAESPHVRFERDASASSSSARTIARGRGQSPTAGWDTPIAQLPPSMQTDPASSSSKASSASIESAQPMVEEQIQAEPLIVSEPEPSLPVQEEQEQAEVLAAIGQSEQLPSSGFGLDLLAVGALGAVMGRRRVQRA